MPPRRTTLSIAWLGWLVASACAGDGAALPPAPDAAPVDDGSRLGAFHDGDDLVVRVRSERATRIDVELFDTARGAPALRADTLVRRPGSDVWEHRLRASELPEVVYYGYRAWGPNWADDPAWSPGSLAGFVVDVDGDGNRFNPNKLLVDPYARELSHDPVQPDGPGFDPYRSGDADRQTDTAPFAPKGIVLADEAPDAGDRPDRPLRDDVIYEVHLRGLTRGDPSVDCAGTYRAAGERAPALAALGVTAVELLPLAETQNDTNDVAPSTDGDNYWGYSTLAFFAPDRRYACDQSPGGPTRELRAMVRAFHAAGLKVYADVVFNHTAEGGAGGGGTVTKLLSWRGLDNASYYELSEDGRGFTDSTGTGANINATSDLVRDLVLDSLRYWSQDLGFDGFRFDLAPVLGNGCERGCFTWQPDDPAGVLARAVAELPARSPGGGAGVDLIAEPWGVTAGTYQLGEFPAGWAQWNDRFRIAVRTDQNVAGRTQPLRELAARIAGSADVFADDGGVHQSINYVASHDGFTLRDIYACDVKRNDQPWPFGPSGGGDDDNRSWDQDGDPADQRQAARTGLALLMVAVGVPMITGGDEMYRTQRCNNNPYNLDSDGNWLDWRDRDSHAPFHQFAERLIAFRRAQPSLRRADAARPPSFHDPAGAAAGPAYLDDPGNRFLGLRIAGEPTIYIAYHGGAAALRITLPAPGAAKAWHRVADTAPWMEPLGNFHPPGEESPLPGAIYDLAPRSLALFIERSPEE